MNSLFSAKLWVYGRNELFSQNSPKLIIYAQDYLKKLEKAEKPPCHPEY
tara:strand:- start:619 stop:765 length:147 start_codon:yes stop_codon:yes gene_type:complete